MNKRTIELPPIDLADPIWTIEHLALALRQGERATRTLIADPAFPAGFRLSASPTARQYWLRDQILDHFASLCAATPAPARAPRPAPRTTPAVPTQSRPTAADRDAAALAELATLPTTANRSIR